LQVQAAQVAQVAMADQALRHQEMARWALMAEPEEVAAASIV
jgi:hypothetical protein